MSETRYIKTFKDGVLVSTESYEVSDEQLAEELADKRMIELRNQFKQGASGVVSNPQTGEYRIMSIERNAAGKMNAKYNNIPE